MLRQVAGKRREIVMRALRKTAQRIHDLEQLRALLARELTVPLP
jgi:hypothetical protein